MKYAFQTKERRKHRQRFYQSRQWQLVRRYKLEKNPLCELCLKERKISLGSLVDHIDPAWGSADEFLDVSKLQSLCSECHVEKTFMQDFPKLLKSKKTKTELVKI